MLPGIVAGALLVFTLSIDDYVITSFVAGVSRHCRSDLRQAEDQRDAGNQRDLDVAPGRHDRPDRHAQWLLREPREEEINDPSTSDRVFAARS